MQLTNNLPDRKNRSLVARPVHLISSLKRQFNLSLMKKYKQKQQLSPVNQTTISSSHRACPAPTTKLERAHLLNNPLKTHCPSTLFSNASFRLTSSWRTRRSARGRRLTSRTLKMKKK